MIAYHPTIPYDVLHNIFETYFNDILAKLPFRPPRPSVHEGPLLLSHVCTFWRDVAFSMPKLWSTFRIDESIAYPLVSHFLTLARDSPLSFDVCLWYGIKHDAATNVWDLLLLQMPKWRWIQLWVDENMTETFLSKFGSPCGSEPDAPGIPMPWESLLETAAIKGGFSVPQAAAKKLWSFLLDQRYFPHLRELEWALDCGDYDFHVPGASIRLDDHNRQFNYDNLTHLTLTQPPSMAECILLLQRCSHLQTLNIIFPSATPLTPQYMSIDFRDILVTPPKTLRKLTIGVDSLVMRNRMCRLISSCLGLGSDDYVIDVY